MKLIYVFVMAAVLLLSLPCIAQKSNTKTNQQAFKRLHIGDMVPMESIVFDNVRNHPGGKAKLSDFKGKYIILDFWSKGCSSCIAAFPHMEELQKQFKDDIQVLLVTYDTEKDLDLLSKNSPNLKNTKLPVVIGEQVLTKELFPASSLPYHVWLDRSGKVVATTWQQETTPQNLKDLIAGKPMDHIMVQDKGFVFDLTAEGFEKMRDEFKNPKQSLLTLTNRRYLKLLRYYVPISASITANRLPETVSQTFVNEDLKKIQLAPYYSMFMNYNMDAESLNLGAGRSDFELKDVQDKTIGFRMLNTSIDQFYQFAYYSDTDARSFYQDFKKILLDGNAKLFYEEITDSTNFKRHHINNRYSYESCIPDYTLEKARKLLQLDLARCFGMTASAEMRPIRHLILMRLGTPEEKNLWAKDQTVVQDNGVVNKEKDGLIIKGGGYLGFVYNYLGNANRNTEDPIIIDGTNFSSEERRKNVDVFLKLKSLRATAENIPLIRKELAGYGLGLKEEMRTVKVLVLKAAL